EELGEAIKIFFRHASGAAQFVQILPQQKAAVFLKPLGVLVHEALIERSHEEQHTAEGIKEGNVASRRHGKKEIGVLGRSGAPRVDDHHVLLGPGLLAGANAIERDRVSLGHVAADNQNDIGQFDVVIASGRAIAPQAGAIAGDSGSHAQPAVGVGIVATDTTLEELVDYVNGLGIELAAAVESDGVRTVAMQDVGENIGDI